MGDLWIGSCLGAGKGAQVVIFNGAVGSGPIHNLYMG